MNGRFKIFQTKVDLQCLQDKYKAMNLSMSIVFSFDNNFQNTCTQYVIKYKNATENRRMRVSALTSIFE